MLDGTEGWLRPSWVQLLACSAWGLGTGHACQGTSSESDETVGLAAPGFSPA